MSLISPLNKMRRSSTVESNIIDEKFNCFLLKGEHKKSKVNLQKSIDNLTFAEGSTVSGLGADHHSANEPKNTVFNRNDHPKSEVYNKPPFLLGSLPYKGDKKLINKLQMMGFKAQQEFADPNVQLFYETLKGESVKGINSNGTHNSQQKQKVIHKNVIKHRVYKKATIIHDTSLEQSKNLECKIETEPGEVEEALKKTLIITPSNKPANSQLAHKTGISLDRQKDKKVLSMPSMQNNIQIRTGGKDTHSVSYESMAAEKYPVSSKSSIMVNQKFGPLEQIDEIHRKTAMHTSTICVSGNGMQNRNTIIHAMRPTSPSSKMGTNVPIHSSIKSSNPAPGTFSFKDNALNFLLDASAKNAPLLSQSIKLQKLQKLLESEIFESVYAEKVSAPSTPFPNTTTPLNNVNVGGQSTRVVSNDPLLGNSNEFNNIINTFINSGANGPSQPTSVKNSGNTRLAGSSKLQQQPGIARSKSIANRIKTKAANAQNSEANSVDESGNVIATHITNNSSSVVQKPHNKPNMVNKNEESNKKKTPTNNQVSVYKYYVGKGNNSAVVKRVLKARSWWEPTPIYDHSYNLRWQQNSRGYKFERLIANSPCKQLVNHFEFHSEITTKNGLIKSLSRYCDANKTKLSDITPTTFVFDMDDEVNFDSDMQYFARYFIQHSSKKDNYPKPDPNDKKNSDVWYNFDYRKRGKYQIPNLSVEKFISPYLKPKMKKNFSTGSDLWVLKPTGLNRGRGIEVFNSLEELNEMMNQYFSRVPRVAKKTQNEGESGSEDSEEEEEEEKKKRGRVIKSRTFVIQKYIENLFLVNNRKFDIRVWTLVTSDMQLYFFKEGYLRTCSEEYTVNDDNILNKFVHLTNNAIQKHGDNYGNHESGNQLSFKDLEKYAEANSLDLKFQENILPMMKDLIEISMESAKRTMNLNDRKHCFEIFGYDFMIDADYRAWLIEINTNPCIEESSPLLKQLIPRMLDDAFKLTLDVLFPKPNQVNKEKGQINPSGKKEKNLSDETTKNCSEDESEVSSDENMKESSKPKPNFSVDGYDDNENMWEFLCSIQPERGINKKGKK